MLFQLLKNVKNWVFNLGQGIADAEDRAASWMFEKEEKE